MIALGAVPDRPQTSKLIISAPYSMDGLSGLSTALRRIALDVTGGGVWASEICAGIHRGVGLPDSTSIGRK
jgi:hypothetical protein